MIIVPGDATYTTNVQYSPQGSAVIHRQYLLKNYIQGVDSTTTIQGSTDSTIVVPWRSTNQADTCDYSSDPSVVDFLS